MLTSQILSNGHVSRQVGPRGIAAFGHLGADPVSGGQTPAPGPHPWGFCCTPRSWRLSVARPHRALGLDAPPSCPSATPPAQSGPTSLHPCAL